MCAILILAALIVSIVVAFVLFVKTAIILLPWSLSAAVVAVLSSVLAEKFLVRPVKPELAMPISLVSTFVLTLVLSYFGYTLVRPKVPKPAPSKRDLSEVLDFPSPTQEKLEEHIPTHFFIAASLSTAVVAIFWPMISAKKGTWPPEESQSLDEGM